MTFKNSSYSYYIITVINTVWHWWKERDIGQRNRIRETTNRMTQVCSTDFFKQVQNHFGFAFRKTSHSQFQNLWMVLGKREPQKKEHQDSGDMLSGDTSTVYRCLRSKEVC